MSPRIYDLAELSALLLSLRYGFEKPNDDELNVVKNGSSGGTTITIYNFLLPLAACIRDVETFC